MTKKERRAHVAKVRKNKRILRSQGVKIKFDLLEADLSTKNPALTALKRAYNLKNEKYLFSRQLARLRHNNKISVGRYYAHILTND